MATALLHNQIIINKNNIVLGKSISNFFLKKKIKFVSIIIDYKHSSLIIWGVNPNISPLDTSRTFRHREVGKEIYYPDFSHDLKKIMGTQGRRNTRAPRELGIINIELREFVNKSTRCLVKPLNANAVIAENIEMDEEKNIEMDTGIVETETDDDKKLFNEKFFGIRQSYINVKERYIIIGRANMGLEITPEDLIRRPSPNVHANVNPHANVNTHNNANPQTTQKNPSTGLKNAPGAHINPHIQTNTSTQANEQNTPISKEAAKVDSEYKDMILGDN